MNRRAFLAAALPCAAGGLYVRGAGAPLRPAQRRLARLGVQLYTVRRELAADFEGTLARVAALGYTEAEFAGYHGRTPEQARAALEAAGLSAPSAHIGVEALGRDLRPEIEAARHVGHRYLVCAYLPPDLRRTLDDYRRLAGLLNRAGRRLRSAGLRLAYHNHDFEFAPLGGRVPFDLLLASTDPRAVAFELDLYWVSRAGQSPLRYLSGHAGRFPLLHVKDMDATPRRSFTEVGRGQIDFRRIFAAAGAAGARHFFVEQDETPGPALASLKLSADYLKQLEF